MTPTTEFDYKKFLNLVSKKRRLFVVIALAIMTCVVVTSYFLTEKYEAKCTVFIEKSIISDLVRGIAVTPSIDDKIRVLGYAMKSRTLLLKVIKDLDLNVGKKSDAELEKLIKQYQERTDIKLKDREGLFIISFHHEVPRVARDYVNTLVRRYIEENVSSKREDSYDATRFISGQIAAIKEKHDKAEAMVNDLKRQKGDLLSRNEYTILSEINDAQQKLDEVSIKRNQLESMRSTVMKNNPLQTKLADLKKRLNELNMVYTDNYPEVIEVKNLIETVKAQLKSNQAALPDNAAQNPPELQRIAMELNTLKEIERNQRRFIATRRAQMLAIPAAKASLEELERERISQKNLYEQLLARYEQSEVSKQVEVQDKAATFRIVDPAVTPIKPFSPKRVKIILFGILAGFVGSFLLLVLFDQLDRSVRNLDELKSLGVPILAVVPSIRNPAEQVAARRRDIRFFAMSGVYFSFILATLSIECLRSYSITFMSPAQIRQSLSLLKEGVLK